MPAWLDDLLGTAASEPHAPDHLSSGTDEVDGDKLDIDYAPTNYVRQSGSVPGGSGAIVHLAAHLAGVDVKLGQLDDAIAAVDTTLQAPTDPGEDLRVAYAQSGDLAYSPGLVFAAGGATVSRLDLGPQTEAGLGVVRATHGSIVLSGPNDAGTQNAQLIRWGTVDDDVLWIGDGSEVARLGLDAVNEVQLIVADVQKLVVQATQILPLTTVAFGSQVATFGASPAASGQIRLSHAQSITGLSTTAATRNVVSWGLSGDNRVEIGDDSVARVDTRSASVFGVKTGGTERFAIGTANVSCKLTVLIDDSFSLLLGQTNVATAGTQRVQHGFSLQGRNNGASANAPILRWGAITDGITLGGDTLVANADYRVATGGDHSFFVNNSEVARIQVNALQVLQPGLIFAAAVANPSFHQLDETGNGVNGDRLTIRAQNANGTNGTEIGGPLRLQSGAGHASAAPGALEFYIGANARGIWNDDGLHLASTLPSSADLNGASFAVFMQAATNTPVGSTEGAILHVNEDGFLSLISDSESVDFGDATAGMLWENQTTPGAAAGHLVVRKNGTTALWIPVYSPGSLDGA